MDCPICMSSCVFPIKLKCEHIFCYLCVKGVTHLNNKCPLCRKKISRNILNQPKFVKKNLNCDRPSGAFNSHQWFYSGRGGSGSGWWAYDWISSKFLENAFNSKLKTCEITVAGVEYTVDFDSSVQYPKYQPMKKRNIKRDLLRNIQMAKGVAGVSKHLVEDVFGKVSDNQSHCETNSDTSHQQNVMNCSSTSVVTNIVEIENQNQVQVKTEIKTEIKVENVND